MGRHGSGKKHRGTGVGNLLAVVLVSVLVLDAPGSADRRSLRLRNAASHKDAGGWEAGASKAVKKKDFGE